MIRWTSWNGETPPRAVSCQISKRSVVSKGSFFPKNIINQQESSEGGDLLFGQTERVGDVNLYGKMMLGLW